MTNKKKLKKAVRARAREQDISYSQARLNFVGPTPPSGAPPSGAPPSRPRTSWPGSSDLGPLGPRALAALAYRAALRVMPVFVLPKALDSVGAYAGRVEAAIEFTRRVAADEVVPEDGDPSASWRAYEASEVALDLESAFETTGEASLAGSLRLAVEAACGAVGAARTIRLLTDAFQPELMDSVFMHLFAAAPYLGFETEGRAAFWADMQALVGSDHQLPVPIEFFARPLWVAWDPTPFEQAAEAHRGRVSSARLPLVYRGPIEVQPGPTIRTDAVRRGTLVRLGSGLLAEVLDNRRGNGRSIRVHGPQGEEVGDHYAHDFQAAFVDGVWRGVELTPHQQQVRGWVRSTRTA